MPEEFGCNKCNFKTKHQVSIKRHLLDVHEKIKAYACNFCEQTSAKKNDMMQHVQKSHPNGNNIPL